MTGEGAADAAQMRIVTGSPPRKYEYEVVTLRLEGE